MKRIGRSIEILIKTIGILQCLFLMFIIFKNLFISEFQISISLTADILLLIFSVMFILLLLMSIKRNRGFKLFFLIISLLVIAYCIYAIYYTQYFKGLGDVWGK